MASGPQISWDGLFASEVILPTQVEVIHQTGGSKKLLLAVLEDAIDTYASHLQANKYNKEFYQAYNWLISNDQKFIFSFVTICHILDLDPDCLRKGIFAKFGRPIKIKPDTVDSSPGKQVKSKRLFRRHGGSRKDNKINLQKKK